jgi:ribonuclease VapC
VSKLVLDTSVVLAILHNEPGSEFFLERLNLLSRSVISAVNVAEAFGKLVERGMEAEEAWDAIMGAVPEVVDFDKEQARVAGELLPRTRSKGLSLGDRACLALAMVLRSPVYTADRAWKDLNFGVKVHVVR